MVHDIGCQDWILALKKWTLAPKTWDIGSLAKEHRNEMKLAKVYEIQICQSGETQMVGSLQAVLQKNSIFHFNHFTLQHFPSHQTFPFVLHLDTNNIILHLPTLTTST